MIECLSDMQTKAMTPEDDKSRSGNLPDTLANVRAEIDRMLVDLHGLETRFQQNLQQSLAAVAQVVEEQVKQAVATAEQAARKQVQADLRMKYGKELELAVTEKSLMERRLQVATK